MPRVAPLHALGTGHVVRRREDEDLLVLLDDLAGQRVQRHDALDLVAEHLDADRELLVDREHLDRVAPHAERAAGEGEVVAGVLDVDEPAQQLVALDGVADGQPDHAVDVLLRRAEAVDAGDRGHDDDVAAGQQRHGGRVPQPLDLLVDRGVLLDVGVAVRDVRLGLVVVVVADEVLDRVAAGTARGTRWPAGRPAVLFGAITSVGRCTCSTSQAVVALCPVRGAEQHDVGGPPRAAG
jgi:hypothetical protein